MTRIFEGAFRMIDHSSEVDLEYETSLFYLIQKPDWSLSVHLHGGELDTLRVGSRPYLKQCKCFSRTMCLFESWCGATVTFECNCATGLLAKSSVELVACYPFMPSQVGWL